MINLSTFFISIDYFYTEEKWLSWKLKFVYRAQVFLAPRIELHSKRLINIGSAKYFSFLANVLKKTTEYFATFFFYLKVQSVRLTMETNFIQMAASAGHAVAYTIGPIFKHILDCVQLDFTNGFSGLSA